MTRFTTSNAPNRLAAVGLAVASVLAGPSLLLAQAQNDPAGNAPSGNRIVINPGDASGDVYDSTRFVETFRKKVSPLKGYMSEARQKVQARLGEAVQRLDADDIEGSIDKSLEALDAVTENRDKIESQLFEAQQFLATELGKVRLRLAEHLDRAGKSSKGQIDENSRRVLQEYAQRVKNETDPNRQRVLKMQMTQVAMLARTKAMASQLDSRHQQLYAQMLNLLQKMQTQLAMVGLRTETMFTKMQQLRYRMQNQRQLLATAEGMKDMVQMFDEVEQVLNDPDVGGLGRMLNDLSAGADLYGERLDATMSEVEAAVEARAAATEAQIQTEANGGIRLRADPETEALVNEFLQDSESGEQ